MPGDTKKEAVRGNPARKGGASGEICGALSAAFPATTPVLTGYLCLGLAYGFLMRNIGYHPLWVLLFSLVVYGGSLQYAGIQFLRAAAFAPVSVLLISVMISARHIFYGLSFLDRYREMGKARPFLIATLTDETFSLLSTLSPPEGVSERDFCFWISLLNYLYWSTGSVLGALLGEFLRFNTTGLDFVLTALFVVLFMEQWKKKENRPAGAIGVVCTALSLAVFGADNLVIPAMILILAVLLGGRKKLCQ